MKAVITGASRGIGAGLAQAYRDKGYDVVGTGRSTASDFVLDVTRPADHVALASSLGNGPVDLLVCNAGIYLDKGQNLESGYAADLWQHTFAANVTGVFLTVQALLPLLRRAPQPKIAIMSSQMASHTRATGRSYIYRASKAAVLNLGRNLATDLKPEGIAVGVYHPGWVQTDMGGAHADISVDESVQGLMSRFADLDVSNSGVFETWDGRAHVY